MSTDAKQPIHQHQLLIAITQAANYRHAPKDDAPGSAYFQFCQLDYLVIDCNAHLGNVYDENYLAAHGCLLTTIGQEDLRYKVYKLCQ